MRKCIYCGSLPYVRNLGGLFYVQCSCGNFNPYEFCGIHPKNAMEVWDEANSLASKINLEHARQAARVGPYFYIIGGKRYDTVAGACKAAGCAIKTLRSKFGALTNTCIIRGHVITRVKRVQRQRRGK